MVKKNKQKRRWRKIINHLFFIFMVRSWVGLRLTINPSCLLRNKQEGNKNKNSPTFPWFNFIFSGRLSPLASRLSPLASLSVVVATLFPLRFFFFFYHSSFFSFIYSFFNIFLFILNKKYKLFILWNKINNYLKN